MAYKKYENRRKSNLSTVGEGISDMLKSFHLENKYLQTLIMTKWELLMGPTVATRTEKIFFKEKAMYVKLSSAALKHQLSMSREKIKDLLNNEVNQQVIEEIIFL